jgi:hypothetical protein
MSSSGTASSISPQEGLDLLSKLITEAAKLQAVLRGVNGLACGVIGILGAVSSTRLVVKPDGSPNAPFIAFNPLAASGFRYAAGRAVPEFPPDAGLRFLSALTVRFPDGSELMLLEIAVD